jgi:MFS family permease
VATLDGGFRAPFTRYWLSGFLADFGDGVRLAAFPLLAAQLTHSPTAVAAVSAAQSLPWLLIGAGAGVLVDRTDRRRLMVIVDVTRAVLIVGLAVAVLTNKAGLALIYLTGFATGVGSALRDTAAVTCIPRLVDSADLDRANARVIAGRIVGNELAGPAAGGWLFGLAAVLPFAVNAGALGIAVLLLLTLPSVFQPVPATTDRDVKSPLVSVWHDLREGARWLWRHADIRDTTIATGVIVFVDAWWFAILVLYVIQVLHQRPGVYGLLLAVAAPGGISVGGLGPWVARRVGPWRSLLAAGAVVAASQAGLGLTSNVIVAAVMLLANGAALALFEMTTVTMRQRQVPPELLGRITSWNGTVQGGAVALGALVGGVLAAAGGIRAPMLIGALPIIATVVLLAWRHRADQPARGATSR